MTVRLIELRGEHGAPVWVDPDHVAMAVPAPRPAGQGGLATALVLVMGTEVLVAGEPRDVVVRLTGGDSGGGNSGGGARATSGR